MRHRWSKLILDAVVLLSLLVSLSTLGLWWRARHKTVSFHFHSRQGLSEFAVRDGRFCFDNEPQHALELDAVRADLTPQVADAFARAYDYYEKSGRDLAADGHADERQKFDEEVERAHELEDRISERDDRVREKWRLVPPVYRSIRCAPIAIAAAMPPLLWIISATMALRRRRRRQQANCCLACGYDLRATPARCPECGREVRPMSTLTRA